MANVTATGFAKNFGRYREAAQREPIAITSHGRISGYFISPHEYAELERLRAYERRVYRIEDLPDDVADAISAASVDAKHDHLNRLLDDK
jgi:PHD/YefM family antitoxin component YafN of YafNO toxin-antitoxin module